MNKKACLKTILILLGLAAIILMGLGIYQSIQTSSNYKSFCNGNPSVCYCEMGVCEFRGLDESIEKAELCDLANKLNDTRVMFKVGCDQ